MHLFKKGLIAFLSVLLVFNSFSFIPVYAASKIDIAKPVTLTWYVIGSRPRKDTPKVEKKIHEYLVNKYKMNTSVKLVCYDYGSYPDKMENIIASKKAFDICFTSSWSNNYYIKAPKGAFLPLNNLLSVYAPKTKALLGESYLKGAQIKGINYAIPANQEKASQMGLVLRKDLVNKYKMDITKIKRLSDLESFLAVIKEYEPEMDPLEGIDYHLPIPCVSNFDYMGFLSPPGVLDCSSKDVKVFNEFKRPEVKDFFKTMHKFYTLGYVSKNIDYSMGESHLDEDGQVFAAIVNIYPGQVYHLKEQTGYDWVTVPLSPAVMTTLEAASAMQAISATSPNPERALMFLELVNTDEYLNNLINFGIENEHYVKTGKKSIEFTKNVYNYEPQTGWVFGNQFLNYTLPGQDPDYWDAFKDFNAKAQPSKALGFVFDPSEVKQEIAYCSIVWDDYVPGLKMGELDPDIYLPEMLQKFEAAGADKIIAEKQRQLNYWLTHYTK